MLESTAAVFRKIIWVGILLCCFVFLIYFQWVCNDLVTSICSPRMRVYMCLWSAREKSLETLHHGRELNRGQGDDRRWYTFILLEPSWPEPRGWQTVIYIHSLTELSWPGPGEDRRLYTFILPLSYHDPGLGRTASDIHSFSHWAIMTRARGEQTVIYIHSPTELSWPRPGEDSQW